MRVVFEYIAARSRAFDATHTLNRHDAVALAPQAQRAFDLLVANVESGAALPPNQCVPRGGAIAGSPAQPGHCANLFVP